MNLAATFAVLVFTSTLVITIYTPETSAQESQQWSAPTTKALNANSISWSEMSYEHQQSIYARECSVCHGPDGSHIGHNDTSLADAA